MADMERLPLTVREYWPLWLAQFFIMTGLLQMEFYLPRLFQVLAEDLWAWVVRHETLSAGILGLTGGIAAFWAVRGQTKNLQIQETIRNYREEHKIIINTIEKFENLSREIYKIKNDIANEINKPSDHKIHFEITKNAIRNIIFQKIILTPNDISYLDKNSADAIFRTNTSCDTIRLKLKLIDFSELPDEKIDRIIEKEQYMFVLRLMDELRLYAQEQNTVLVSRASTIISFIRKNNT